MSGVKSFNLELTSANEMSMPDERSTDSRASKNNREVTA